MWRCLVILGGRGGLVDEFIINMENGGHKVELI